MRARQLSAVISLSLCVISCGQTTNPQEMKCYTVKTNTTTDGTQPCAQQACHAGQWCWTVLNSCLPGCADEGNCAMGQTCDRSHAVMNSDGTHRAGVCRAPTAAETVPCAGPPPDPNSDMGTHPCSGGGGGSSAGCQTNKCYSVALSNSSSGTPCGQVLCPTMLYCANSATNICNPGCSDESNCPVGQTCDHSHGAVGSCRPPTPAEEIPCGTAAPDMAKSSLDMGTQCDDVHGVYMVVLNQGSSSAGCANGFTVASCTVAQTGCNLTFNCNQATGFAMTTLDSSDKGQSTVSAGGQTIKCNYAFNPALRSLGWECIPMYMGASLDCKGTGTLQ